MRTYCVAQGTLLSALWGPKWERIQKRGDICVHRADSLCCTLETNTHDTVKQVYSNKHFKNTQISPVVFIKEERTNGKLNKIPLTIMPENREC